MYVEPGQIYTKNNVDFCVHEVKGGWVYGVTYRSEDRGNIQNDGPYSLKKITLAEFWKTDAELIKE